MSSVIEIADSADIKATFCLERDSDGSFTREGFSEFALRFMTREAIALSLDSNSFHVPHLKTRKAILLDPPTRLVSLVNCPGGSPLPLFRHVVVSEAIRTIGGDWHAFIGVTAESAAATMLCGADHIFCLDSSRIMVHNATDLVGSDDDFKDRVRSVLNQCTAALLRRGGHEVTDKLADQVANLAPRDVFEINFSGAQAADYGLVDESFPNMAALKDRIQRVAEINFADPYLPREINAFSSNYTLKRLLNTLKLRL